MAKSKITLQIKWKPVQGWMIKKGSDGNVFFALVIWVLFKSTPVNWHYDIVSPREAF